MRTNIEIDDELMKQAMKATWTKTKKAAVDAALKNVVRLDQQIAFRELWGKFPKLDINLDESRLSRFPE